MGELKEVSLLSQVFSIPVVTDKKTTTSHTTNDMTKIDIIEINDVDRAFFLGIKYFRAKRSSYMVIFILFRFFEDNVFS